MRDSIIIETYLRKIYIAALLFVLLTGAHSHIRGLGLDDALEARQVLYILTYFSINTQVIIQNRAL